MSGRESFVDRALQNFLLDVSTANRLFSYLFSEKDGKNWDENLWQDVEWSDTINLTPSVSP